MFERRNSFRLSKQVVVKYEMESDNSRLYLTGYSDNISNTGICIRTSKKLDDSQNIKLKISLPSFDDLVQVNARIAWTRRHAAGSMYLLGLVFTSIDNNIKKIIDQAIMSDKFGVISAVE